MFEIPHRPNGKMADVLAPTHSCTTAAETPVNYSMYVPHLENFPLPRWETHVLLVVCREAGYVPQRP
jgi:hypothetical protein